uniref:helix-turn-helix domain-containing protein n=1 Tax=Staphylococcus warneri TaxID=1292 RepID=UPI003B9E4C00
MPPFKITLKAARVNCGLTLKDVAEAVGRSTDYISKFESDSSNIPYDLMLALLEL